MRKGRKTGSPVSVRITISIFMPLHAIHRTNVPGCSVESTTFFARHNSAFIDETSLCLYEEIRRFACSSPAEETSSILRALAEFHHQHGSDLPWIRDVGGMADTAPVGAQVILGGGKVPVPGKRGGHWQARYKESD